jgi:hypothetical protein
MSNRTLAAAVLLAVLPLSLVACGDDNDKADTTTTTAKVESTTTQPSGSDDTSDTSDTTDDTTETTVEGVGFGEGVDKAQQMLAAADDPCAVWDINDYLSTVGQPEGADEVKAAVEVTAALWKKMADTAPDSLSAEADVFRQMAAEFPQQAEAAGYDFEKIASLDLITSEAAGNAQQKYAMVIGEQCGGEGDQG